MLANPNNPTGNLLNGEGLLRLLDEVEFVIVDESFVDFIGAEYSVRQMLRSHKNLVVVQSLTKFFAIPGLRLGFAAAEESIIKQLNLGKDVWNVNYLAHKVGAAALADENYIIKTRHWLEEERAYVKECLSGIKNLKYFDPTVNFVLIKLETESIALKVIEELRKHKILVRSCANFRGLNLSYIRLAIRNHKENRRVIDLLAQILFRNLSSRNQ